MVERTLAQRRLRNLSGVQGHGSRFSRMGCGMCNVDDTDHTLIHSNSNSNFRLSVDRLCHGHFAWSDEFGCNVGRPSHCASCWQTRSNHRAVWFNHVLERSVGHSHVGGLCGRRDVPKGCDKLFGQAQVQKCRHRWSLERNRESQQHLRRQVSYIYKRNRNCGQVDSLTFLHFRRVMDTWTKQSGLPVLMVTKTSETEYLLEQKRFLSNPSDEGKPVADSEFKWVLLTVVPSQCEWNSIFSPGQLSMEHPPHVCGQLGSEKRYLRARAEGR